MRSNKAGIAVSGEITLHHDRAYIQVGQFGLSSGHGILIRTCKGRKDYTGWANHFVALGMLDDIPALAAAVRAVTGVGRDASRRSERRRLNPANPIIAGARAGRRLGQSTATTPPSSCADAVHAARGRPAFRRSP
ncbi:hypothetical protein NKH61_30755 [Mesorhizobium sp. M1005]|uniref:hypothetical protein n=1 Tax=Mesorhizobium sp. M1005 TaxID=2957047 RepID=UPI00333713B0